MASISLNSDAHQIPPVCLTYKYGEWKWNGKEPELIGGKEFEVLGTLCAEKLHPGRTYEVCFLLMMVGDATGFDVALKYVLSDGTEIPSPHQIKPLENMPPDEAQYIPIKKCFTNHGMNGDITISLSATGCNVKKGLVIKEFVIREKAIG